MDAMGWTLISFSSANLWGEKLQVLIAYSQQNIEQIIEHV